MLLISWFIFFFFNSKNEEFFFRFLLLSIVCVYYFLFSRWLMLYVFGLVIVSSRNLLEIVRFFMNISELMFLVKLLWNKNVVSSVKFVVNRVVVWVRKLNRIVRLLLNLSRIISGSIKFGMFIVFIYCWVFV